MQAFAEPDVDAIVVDREGQAWLNGIGGRRPSGLQLDPLEVEEVVKSVIAVFGAERPIEGASWRWPNRGWRFTGVLPPFELPPIFEIHKPTP